ncbi:alpha/beta fold hydrolase [Pelagovum pacificum]|uniref:Alpha/beta fold hydrolase n=1 Tax=Pelagovum pacificum TaxID=2588711 RepID=A0A5C5GE77_9RHOB|nr:alpha/beta fold hydrolase [Pelagovum pacificum]QQA41287.1 alpha/beta fold hydrolase [Pelagovum pacificum]TNY31906.1 alpha/beta fold hydrolase [Pelagovum pacificum]
MTPEQILALIAALSGEPDPSAFAGLRDGGFDSAYPVEIVPCNRPVVPNEIEGETVICGTVDVPVDHDAPGDDTFTIRFDLYKARSLSPEPDPVMYLHGGPGDGIATKTIAGGRIFDFLRERRDIVTIDERGVDSSAPEMDCYGTLATDLEDVVALVSGTGTGPLPGEFLTACLEELDARGIDYTKINTYQNARDVPAVLAALGYDTYNLYGGSYGTKLAMEILRQDPPGLRSVVIDGNAPPWMEIYSSFWESHASPISVSLSPCERDPVCAEAYPDIVARTFALLDTLAETPIETASGDIDYGAILDLFEGRNDPYGPLRGLTPYIPLMVTQLEQGDTTLFDQARAGTLIPKTDAASVRAQAAAAGLGQAEMAQVEAMLSAAEHVRLASETVTAAAQALEAERDSDAINAGLAEIFDDRLAAAITAMPDATDRIAAGRDYLDLRFVEPSVPALTSLIAEHFDGDVAEDLTSLARQLAPGDVDRVFQLVEVDNAGTMANLEGSFQLFLYACQEDFVGGRNTRETFAETMAADGRWGPNMQQELLGGYGFFWDACPAFEPQPRDNWPLQAETDVPVLAMNGEVDSNTAPVWGERAIETFSNATNVMVPESGHGTILFSQCARDISAAFIADPEGDLDTSCVEGERLPVMLPDGTMHALPY